MIQNGHTKFKNLANSRVIVRFKIICCCVKKKQKTKNKKTQKSVSDHFGILGMRERVKVIS